MEEVAVVEEGAEVEGFTIVDKIAVVNGGAEVEWDAMMKGMNMWRHLQWWKVLQ